MMTGKCEQIYLRKDKEAENAELEAKAIEATTEGEFK